MMTWTKKLMLAAVATLGMAAPALAHENVNRTVVQPIRYENRFDGNRFDNDRFDRGDFRRAKQWRKWQRIRRMEQMRRHRLYGGFHR
jgi:hypothetical protein